MSEWLDLMLEEIVRKRAECDEAALESERRAAEETEAATAPAAGNERTQAK